MENREGLGQDPSILTAETNKQIHFEAFRRQKVARDESILVPQGDTSMLRRAVGALLLSGIIAAGIVAAGQDTEAISNVTSTECVEVGCEPVPAYGVDAIEPGPLTAGDKRAKIKVTATTVPIVTATTSVTTPPTTLAPKPAPVLAASELIPAPPELDPRIAEALSRVNLTIEGYKEFLAKLDTSHLQHAQELTEFNPQKVAIPQNKTEFITLHNFGYHTEPNLDIDKFAEGMAKRGDTDNPPDHVCCGVNLAVLTTSTVQLAPISAKLRHNKGYDGRTIGIETQADNQAGVTTFEYEEISYASVAMLKHEGLLKKPIDQTIKGHGETRQKYNSDHPGNELDAKVDFNKPESDVLRSHISKLLATNPEIQDLPVNIL